MSSKYCLKISVSLSDVSVQSNMSSPDTEKGIFLASTKLLATEWQIPGLVVILDTILNYTICSRVTYGHPADS